MFHYTDCGLDNVWLKNGYTEVKSDYGNAVSFTDLEGLHKAIGLKIINCNSKLTGQELRFLRNELDLTQNHLAEILGVSENSIRAWENDRNTITSPSDRMIKVLYNEHATNNGVVRAALEKLSQMNRAEHSKRIELETTDHGWKTAA